MKFSAPTYHKYFKIGVSVLLFVLIFGRWPVHEGQVVFDPILITFSVLIWSLLSYYLLSGISAVEFLSDGRIAFSSVLRARILHPKDIHSVELFRSGRQSYIRVGKRGRDIYIPLSVDNSGELLAHLQARCAGAYGKHA